ncbi:MAG: transcriptional repressor [Anaerolineae bacterium]|jgi:Fur family peroxide stress response transcriptional regulator|nr:transcriptional repressor [Anaerolineae bacterium]
MNKPTELIDALQKSGLRLTPQRIAICKILAETDEHPTAAVIYESIKPQYPSLSLATVYNTLEVLVAHGKVNVLGDAGDGKVHFDADTKPHINLACLECHRIIDFSSDFVMQMNEEIKKKAGYDFLGSRLIYYGICPECQKKKSNSLN